jgi:hypothetical protein
MSMKGRKTNSSIDGTGRVELWFNLLYLLVWPACGIRIYLPLENLRFLSSARRTSNELELSRHTLGYPSLATQARKRVAAKSESLRTLLAITVILSTQDPLTIDKQTLPIFRW